MSPTSSVDVSDMDKASEGLAKVRGLLAHRSSAAISSSESELSDKDRSCEGLANVLLAGLPCAALAAAGVVAAGDKAEVKVGIAAASGSGPTEESEVACTVVVCRFVFVRHFLWDRLLSGPHFRVMLRVVFTR